MSLEAESQDRTAVMLTINACAEAYHYVKAQLAPNAGHFEQIANHDKACEAFCAHLPILLGLESFQIYLACIGQGAAIGAIDPADMGRYSHLAQVAMSAWKLANLTVPEAQNRLDPLPSKGNQNNSYESQQARALLPDRKTQNQMFKELRRRRVAIPSEHDLQANPIVALAFCDLFDNHLDKFPPPENEFGPKPGQERLRPPQEAA
jgi:hypothetical protein